MGSCLPRLNILEMRTMNIALHNRKINNAQFIFRILQQVWLPYLLHSFASSKSAKMYPKYCFSKHTFLENQESNNAMRPLNQEWKNLSYSALGWGYVSWLLSPSVTSYGN